jgi:hypothetical protein
LVKSHALKTADIEFAACMAVITGGVRAMCGGT